jgi:hypothetical protein
VSLSRTTFVLAATIAGLAVAPAAAAAKAPAAQAAVNQRCPTFTVVVNDRIADLPAGRYSIVTFSPRRSQITCLDAYHAFRSYLYHPSSHDGWTAKRLARPAIGRRFTRDGTRGRVGFTATRTGRARTSGADPLPPYQDPFGDRGRSTTRLCYEASRNPFTVVHNDVSEGFPKTGRNGGKYSALAFSPTRSLSCLTVYDVLRSYLYDPRGLKGWTVGRLTGELASFPGRRFLKRGSGGRTGFDVYCPQGTANPPRCPAPTRS